MDKILDNKLKDVIELSDIDESDEEADHSYEVKVQPKNSEGDKRQNIKLLCKSEDFSEGLEKLKGLLKKGAQFNFNGCELKVDDEIKVGKTATIHVNTDKLKGKVGIRFYSCKKEGQSVVVMKQSGQDYALVQSLTKQLTDDFISQLQKRSNNKTTGKTKKNYVINVTISAKMSMD